MENAQMDNSNPDGVGVYFRSCLFSERNGTILRCWQIWN